MEKEDYKFLDRVKVTVVEGRNLAPQDRAGTCDPYVSVKLKNTSHKTHSEHNTVNPKWKKEDASFFFEVEGEEHVPELTFICWDKRKAHKNEYLGETKIDLEELNKNNTEEVNQWFILQASGDRKSKNKSSVTGELHICVELLYSSVSEEIKGGKPNAKFFARFPEVPVTEKIISGHGCSRFIKMLRIIGHIYLLQGFLCFRGSIQKKKVCLSWKDIISIEKKKFSPILNAIEIKRKVVPKSHKSNPKTEKTYWFDCVKALDEIVAVWKAANNNSGSDPLPQLKIDTARQNWQIKDAKSSTTYSLDDHFTREPIIPFKLGHRRGRSDGWTIEKKASVERLDETNANSATSQLLRAPNSFAHRTPQGSPSIGEVLELSIETSKHKDLKCEKIKVISISASKPVQSLLNRFAENTIPIEELSHYYLVLPSQGKRKKLILDPVEKIGNYPIKSGDILVLKKRHRKLTHIYLKAPRTLTVFVQVQNSDELRCSQNTSLVLESALTVESALEKIINEGNVPINVEELGQYTIFVNKGDSRGILVQDKSILLSALQVSDKDTLTLVKNCLLKSYYEMFRIQKSKSSVELALEFSGHCLLNPLSKDFALGETSFEDCLRLLSKKLKLQHEEDSLVSWVKEVSSYGPEPLLLELAYRLATLKNHPWYSLDEFGGNQDAFDNWMRKEKKAIENEMRTIVFDKKRFFGILFIQVDQAQNLAPQNKRGSGDFYCVLKLNSDPKTVYKTKVQKELHPKWNEGFQFQVLHPYSTMHLTIMDQDSLHAHGVVEELKIPLSDFQTSSTVDKWYTLGTGRIRIQAEYIFSFSKYLSMASDEKSLPVLDPTLHSLVDHNMFYKIIVKAFLFSQGRDSLKKAGQLLSPDSMVLLQEYRKRFGVRDIDGELVLVRYLNPVLLPQDHHLSLLRKSLDALQSKVDVLTTRERLIYKKGVSQLLPTLEGFITRYKKIFASALVPLETALDCLALLHGSPQKSKEFNNQVVQLIERGIKENYQSLKKEHSHEDGLIRLCDQLMAETTDELFFKETFEKHCSIKFVNVAARAYYTSLIADVESFCDQTTYRSPNVFQLYQKLKELSKHSFFSPVLTEDESLKMDLPELFSPFVFGWLKDTESILKKRVKDLFELKSSQDDSPESSVAVAWSRCKQAFDFLKSLDLKRGFFLNQFSEVACQFTEMYINLARHRAITLINERPEPFSLSKGICVCVNNITYITKETVKLNRELEAMLQEMKLKSSLTKSDDVLIITNEFHSRAQITTNIVISSTQEVVNAICDRINTNVNKTLLQTVPGLKSENDFPLKTLVAYTSGQLDIVQKQIEGELVVQIAGGLWTLIVQDLISLILTGAHQLSGIQVKVSEQIIENLSPYFYLGGKGLQNNFIEHSTRFIHRLVELWSLPIQKLIDVYIKLPDNKDPKQLLNTPKSDQLAREHILSIIKHRSDKEAVAFYKEVTSTPAKHEEIQKVRNHFGLKETELIIDEYQCTMMIENSKHSGYLILTSTSLCFDEDPKSLTSTVSTIIKLKDIDAVIKTKVAYFWGGLQIETTGKKVHSFHSFNVDRDVAFQSITDQAVSIGNSSFSTSSKK